ncbi:MAG: tetratricopeptide repeat protein [Humidesulfovibrio sp.]|uniref:tetratricopeptide repeat protein n=1 Tax=Humidesulfovibrio sp. TaxID=2910988 RepID=UPI0027F78083|nr:tetratricopeptide repeat protein [Humidesulfovibrio sp.]MDQ7836149.1 tetratricopeptide repeat protein [Humidesulfovibrio sp.]
MRAAQPARLSLSLAKVLPALALGLAAVSLACCLTILAPATARAESPYIQGMELYRQGKYDEAARLLRDALPTTTPPQAATARPSLTPVISPVQKAEQLPSPIESPEAAHTRAVLGFTLLRLDQLAEAEDQFNRVRQSPELQSVGLLGSGWAAFSRGRTSAAVELFAEALNQSRRPADGQHSGLPDMLRESVSADALFGQGLIALGRGNAAEATRLLQAATTGTDLLASPKELHLALGDARALAGDTSSALAAWAEVPRRSSRFQGDVTRDELARLKTARLLETSGNAAQALSVYASLAGGQFYQPEALLGQARLLLAQARATEALSALRRLVVLEPTLAEPLSRTIAADPLLRPLNKDWGLAYFHRASYLEALSKLSAYLDDVDPLDYDCLIGLGWSHLRLGQSVQALEAFKDAGRAAKAAPSDPLAGMGAAALSLGRVDEARALLAKSLAAKADNAVALNTLGHLELSQNNPTKALEHFRAALSARPDYVDSRMAAAKILFERGDYDAAAAEYFRLATQERRSVAAWNGLGWARLRLGQYADALQAFSEARRLNPSLPAAAYGLGITLAKQDKPDRASQSLAEAIFLSPDFAATPEVLELMRSRPEYSELFLEMGEAYARKLYPTAAAPYLEEYLQQNPNSRAGRRALAWASFWAGQEDKAHALFQTLLTVNKDDADAHLGDGLALLSRNHLDMAEPHLRDAVRLEPTNPQAWRALVLLLTRQGKQQEAVAAQKSSPKSRLERLDRMSARGFNALSEGRLRDAVRDFYRAVAEDPGLAAPRYGLAFSLVALGDARQAREELLTGLNLDPAYLDDQELGRLLARHYHLGDLEVDLAWSQLYALNLAPARAEFERILAASPNKIGAQFGLGATAYLQADWALAEKSFDKLLPRAPETSPSWDKWSHLMDKLGWAAYHQKKYDKALHAFDWLRTYNAQTPYAAPLSGMGWALLGLEHPGQAQNLFTRSLAIFPRNLTAMLGMTKLKKASESYEEDMDDEPEPTPPPKRKSKKSKKSNAEDEQPATAKKKSKKKAKDDEPAKKSKTSKKKAKAQ